MSIIVKFNGRYLTVEENGNEVLRIEAISGKAGHQNPAESYVKDIGPIPSGQWLIKPSQYQSFDDIGLFKQIIAPVGFGAWRGGTRSWGRSRIWLEPAIGTDTQGRTGLTIHGGTEPGSRGCVDLVENTEFFDYFLSKHEDMTLIVDYGSYDGSYHPLLDKIEEYTVLDGKTVDIIAKQCSVERSDVLGFFNNGYLQDRLNTYKNQEYIALRNKDPIFLPSEGSSNWESYIIIKGSQNGQSISIDDKKYVVVEGYQADAVSYETLTTGIGVNVDLTSSHTTWMGENSTKDYLGNAFKGVIGSPYNDAFRGTPGAGSSVSFEGGKGDDTYELFTADRTHYRLSDSEGNNHLEVNGKILSGTASPVTNRPAGTTWVMETEDNLYILTRVDDTGVRSAAGKHLKISSVADGDSNFVTIQDFQDGQYGSIAA